MALRAVDGSAFDVDDVDIQIQVRSNKYDSFVCRLSTAHAFLTFLPCLVVLTILIIILRHNIFVILHILVWFMRISPSVNTLAIRQISLQCQCILHSNHREANASVSYTATMGGLQTPHDSYKQVRPSAALALLRALLKMYVTMDSAIGSLLPRFRC